MREYVKELLKQCKYADLSNGDEEKGLYVIPMYSKPTFDVGCTYLIRLPKDIVGNRQSVLASNWNHGTAPGYEVMKAYVSKELGSMIYVDSVGVIDGKDADELWSGWLPAKEITQLKKL